jgi:hypothetical protein
MEAPATDDGQRIAILAIKHAECSNEVAVTLVHLILCANRDEMAGGTSNFSSSFDKIIGLEVHIGVVVYRGSCSQWIALLQCL